MNAGQLLKTKSSVDKNDTTGGWFLEATPGGQHIGSFPQNTVLGTFEKEVRPTLKAFTLYYYVKLANPFSSGGKVYNYAYILAEKVFAYSPTMQTAFVKKSVKSLNVRASPSLTAKVLKTVAGGAVIGTTDGSQRNGFYLVNLGENALGWVSANYVAIRAKAAVPTTGGGSSTAGSTGGSTTGSTGSSGGIPPADPSDLPVESGTGEVINTSLDNALGDNNAQYLKYGLGGLLLVIVVLFIVKSRKPKPALSSRKAR